MNGEVVISAQDVYKDYGHVQALRGASLEVHRGEIVALVGDNGAGKSTLMKTMCGAVQPDAGEIRILGRPVDLASVKIAHELGVQTVYQDLALAPDLNVTSNIFLGTEIVRPGVLGKVGWLSRRAMAVEARKALHEFGVSVPSVDVAVSDLSGGQRQAVAIARALRTAENAILLDEPTAALGTRQTEIVIETVRTIAARGLGVLVISHDMPRMLHLAHRIVVLRLGAVVASMPAAEATIPRIVAVMLGASAEAVDAVS